MDQKKIGGFLKELRKERNLTQEDLAEQFNVSDRTVSRWETGSNMPDISILIELAEFYDVSIPEIINGERKSETMKEDVKEAAMSLSDYAEAYNQKIRKRAVWLSIFALVGTVLYLVLDALGLRTPGSVYDKIASFAIGWSTGVLLVMPFALSGMIGRAKAKARMRREAGRS